MSNAAGPHQGQPLSTAGKPLAAAAAAMILVHGRGDSAPSFVQMADYFPHADLAYLAPQASDNTWYPYSFLSPMHQNEPGLSSGLQRLADLVAEVEAAGIPAERIIFAGFSQGACLASEFVARHARRYGGLIAFSGGVIGPPGTPRAYGGSLDGMPVFLGCSDVDAHIPLTRVQETTAVLTALGASVTEKIYPGLPHTIIQDEIDHARALIAGALAPTP